MKDSKDFVSSWCRLRLLRVFLGIRTLDRLEEFHPTLQFFGRLDSPMIAVGGSCVTPLPGR